MAPSSLRAFLRWASRNRAIRLTSEGLRFVLLTVGIGIASINTGNNLLYLLFAMMLSLIVISGVLSERCFKQVDVSRRLPPVLFANAPATAAFVIANRSSLLPVFSLRIMDVIDTTAVDRGVQLLQLLPGAKTVQSYPLLVKRRGTFVLEGVKLFTRFPFGLFVKVATFPVRSEIIVYPEIKDLPPVLLDDLSMAGHDRELPRRGHGTTLHNLRLYQPGDDSRTIHWKTTARKSLLIVRETEAEDQRQVTILLHTHVSDLSGCADFRDLFERPCRWQPRWPSCLPNERMRCDSWSENRSWPMSSATHISLACCLSWRYAGRASTSHYTQGNRFDFLSLAAMK